MRLTPDRDEPRHPPSTVGAELVRLTAHTEDAADPVGRAAAFRRLLAAVSRSARSAGGVAVLRGRWLVDVVLEAAPRLPVRDLETLQAHHRGLHGDLLAEELVATAAKASAAVGAAGGAVAAAQWAAPPTLVTAPVALTAETLAVAAIEIKLVAELHHVYGAAPRGSAQQRAVAYVWAWTRRRGVDPFDPGGIALAVTGPVRRAVRNRLLGRAGRNLTTLGPFLSGAVVGSAANHRETSRLGQAVIEDLRYRRR